MQDLKEKTIRGALVRVCTQIASLFLRVVSVAILARLLDPKDFGLVGMVTAFTGVLSLFRDFGLSAATVQRATVTEQQTTTLFWINIAAGAILAVITVLFAPLIAAFYHEPRLFWVTCVVALSFLFNAAGIQHSAALQRQMRFTALSFIDFSSWFVCTAIAIGMAMFGCGYWALVALTVTVPLSSTIAFWVTTAWVPGLPHRRAGIRSLMRFGGTITLNGLVVYVASNCEKVLLGRFWGAEAIGIYGRAYQLIRLPTDSLNGAVGEVAFAALSRLQGDPIRLRSYFLKGYSVLLALTLPVTFACGIFADDIVLLLLGPKWKDAAIIFRLLTPTILVFALANPFSWFVSSIGLVERGLKMSLVIAPIMIVGYFAGLPYGPKGVAVAYSVVMLLWLLPVIAWSVQGTVVSFKDVIVTACRPLASGVVAAALALGTRLLFLKPSTLWPRLLSGCSVLLASYLVMLMYVMGQKHFYVDIVRQFSKRTSLENEALVSS